MVKPTEEKIAKLELLNGSCDEVWSRELKRGLVRLMLEAADQEFSLVCAVGFSHRTKHLSAFFSPISSRNPNLDAMCDDIAEMFAMMAKRLRQ